LRPDQCGRSGARIDLRQPFRDACDDNRPTTTRLFRPQQTSVGAESNPASAARPPAVEGIQMTGFDDDTRRMIRRNKLLGMWAAEKLGLAGADADAYSDALAMDTIDPDRSDVYSKIRKDFDTAGIAQSREQILSVMNELLLKAADSMPPTSGGDHLDAAAVTIAKNLTPR
jgi:hypothetical protein